MRCWHWQREDEDGCTAFTTEAPLCRQDKGQQDKVLQSSVSETERHKKVLLGWFNSQEHPQQIPQCEQLAGEAILSASIQQWL